MIRINLLPVREFKRREALRRQVSIYFLTVVVLIALMGFGFMTYNSRLKSLQADQADLTKREAEFRVKVKEYDNLVAQKAVLEQRLDVILKLESQRRGPVKVLDEVSKRIPAGKAWLTDLVQKGDVLNLKGVALDNETIAAFMSNLQPPRKEILEPTVGVAKIVDEDPSNIFTDVELVRSAQEIKDELRLKSFAINCKIVLFREKPAEAEAGKPKPEPAKK